MSNRFTVPLRIAAVTAAATVAAVSFAPAASAAEEGDVEVTNTETVQVYTDATGEVQTRRIYEQLALSGEGEVELSNPIETDGLRNLDEFGGYDIEDGEQITNMTVDGEERLRSVSDFTGDLPLEVQVKYLLDGEEVEPGDVVGESGELEVLYTVRNVTSQPQEVTYTDGSGGEVTETVDVPIPMVGSLSTVAPPNFTDVQSEQANLAGDGKGGTKMSFTMTLFPPLGSDTAEFGYTADIEDGVVPRADISALPVNPLDSPTFKTAADSYQGGSDTGEELAAGATEIDSNLLKLRDGAGDLLAGLIQLRDGSGELADGLSGEAAPGSARLADGTEELRNGTAKLAAGTGKLDDGADKIADGAGRLSDGTGEAAAGSKKLTGGLKKISGGLDKLSGVQGLPGAQDGIKQLQAGVDQIIAGFGVPSNPDSLIGGLTDLEAGLAQLETGAGDLHAGLDGQLEPGLNAAKGGVDQVQSGIGDAVANGGSIDQLIGGLNALKANPDCGPACDGFIDAALLPGVQQSKANLTDANNGLLQVSGGLGNAIGALNTQLIPGAAQLSGGLTQAKSGAGKLKAGASQAKAGAQQVAGGLDQLSAGLATAVDGVLQLANGADTAVTGSSDLSAGLGQLDAGAGELAAGAGELSAGTGDLDEGADDLNDGAGQLNDGANELADGLGDAADGSVRLNEGLTEAAGGAPRLVDGTQELSDKGTSKLVEAGEDTAQDYGQLYATIAAGAERADAEKMAYGAPEGATGLTAYSFVVQGESGESGRNWARGLAGLALLGVAGAAFVLRRRFV